MKYCLIIDNEDQKDQIEALEKKAKDQNFPITCYYFKPDKREYLILETINNNKEYVIDYELLKQGLETEYAGKQIDLIASDYLLEDKLLNGLNLLQKLKDNWRGQNVPTLIYSSEASTIRKNLQKEVQEVISDENKLSDFLDNYYDNHPNETTDRGSLDKNSYIDTIISFLKKPRNKTTFSYKLSQKLSQHPERIFENIFPRFNGQKLSALAKILQKNTEESDAFEDEFLDRSVDHFIYLKE